ncbi:N-acetylmuramic acid 6-phosphate etherase [Flexivirga caeni]|uniref:N-acetylmuramic acid 6-phosphate etherase n=1 Tax=Flexivirga caeni TaxID=2294115 RepID=A0A3M9M1D8_9MICO|nr:N-acetylmuramic acid 6-phosphate etherase [Flexivirga caeni]
MNLGDLATEARNPRSAGLDSMDTERVLELMNDEDQTVALAVRQALPQIAKAVDLIANSLRAGGRLVYLGAGTSGRIGLLDAVECPPTFATDPHQVTALLAGGVGAFVQAVEGAEDDTAAAARDVDGLEIGPHDTLVGIAASGRTPYVIAGLRRARERGAATVAVACNTGSLVGREAGVAIEVETGPEVLTGSTRLKAGTAQKMVCNMLSTAAMVRVGKTYGNFMVDMRPTNDKLADRALRIVASATESDDATAARAMAEAGGRTKVAVVMLLADVDADQADDLLRHGGGSVSAAIVAAAG